MKEINETRSWFFENKKIGKSLARITKEKDNTNYQYWEYKQAYHYGPKIYYWNIKNNFFIDLTI